MATFSGEIKNEIINQKCTEVDVALSLLSGIIKTCGEIKLIKKGFGIVLSTESEELFNKVNELLKFIYDKEAKLNSNFDNNFSRTRYEIIFPEDICEKILIDTEIMFYDEDKYLCIYDGISKYIVEDAKHIKAYLKGATLGSFTSNIALEENSLKSNGYHVEYVFSDEKMAQDFSELLSELEIMPKKIERKNSFVVYIKDFEQICLLLEILETPNSCLKLKNENLVREVRNQVNRQNNCIIGNSTKLVNASIKQINAIKTIQNYIGIEKLDENLQQVCYLRLANPEESLDNLVKLSTEKITKSGLYHRLNKIVKIADELKK